MVISFSHEIAWGQLVKHDEVVTFRRSRRKNPSCQTWCNRGRGQTKEFDVTIREIGQVRPVEEELTPYVDRSGFESVEEWVRAIEELNPGETEVGWLYTVTPTESDATISPVAPVEQASD